MRRGGRFFDGDDPEHPPRILLERVEIDGRERFVMLRRIGYLDRHHAEAHVVPADLDDFVTDLTSVPALFTWLVPRTGVHLPAALLHDGLVHDPDGPPSYIGPAVGREEADRIFRDAMGDLGTSLMRRWLMWTAVTLAAILGGRIEPVRRRRVIAAAGLLTIAVLGTLATADLLDVGVELWWMGDRPWHLEVLYGAIAAVVVPVAISAAWGRLWRAGAIAGIALALLLHVTAVLMVLTAAFRVVEVAVERRSPRMTARRDDTVQ
jgi:hypothetical protein